MKKWEVCIANGKISRWFSNLKQAKEHAREFHFGQIIDDLGFVRFIIKNGRIYKIA